MEPAMKIPKRYWQYISAIADANGVDPVDLFEAGAWQVVERGLDLIAAQDEGSVEVELDPALTDMLTELGPLAAVFAHALWPRAAKALRPAQPTPYVAPADAREADGRFKALAARPNVAAEQLPGNPWS